MIKVKLDIEIINCFIQKKRDFQAITLSFICLYQYLFYTFILLNQIKFLNNEKL